MIRSAPRSRASRRCPAPALLGIVLVLLLCAPGLQAQSVYRWVDAQGRVHYGDPSAAPRGAQAVPGARAFGGASLAAIPGTTAGADAGVAGEADACEEARARLISYQSAGDIVETDALGVERRLDDGRREQLLARTELEVDRACAGRP